MKATHMKIDFDVLMDVLEFSLDNAVCKLGTRMIRQVKGIPQGDSLSPAVCIGTLGWYENAWMKKQSVKTKKNMRITRYLDDVLMVINANMKGHTETIKSYTTECSPPGLPLEGEGGECCYLETTIRNDGSNIECQHRNKNATMTHQEYYRGKHAWSFNEEKHKFGAMIGTFLRIERNSSTTKLAFASMKEKIFEFRTLMCTDKQIKHTIS